MARAIWKGAISFGLVHIPVSLNVAVSSERVDFDWLDKRSMEPVGYKRVNKVTGKEIDKDNIVKGVEYEKGRYVVISEQEIRDARPEATQTIDIFSFVQAGEIPLQHFDTPYYLSPDRRGGKVYALLRDTLESTGKVALATVVLHTRQHLALLRPLEDALVLITLRWPEEVRGVETLELDKSVTDAKVDKRELSMAKRLVEDMSGSWAPDEYHDAFRQTILDLVEEKASKGKIETVDKGEGKGVEKGADILDLTELLKRSLGGKPKGGKPAAKRPRKAS
ncbi:MULTISPECIES: Ku protein [Pseudomonas]|jgi:DNA end-binding protein Ku|uniref:Non-homologous end joining protein Ku n=2 Tax=Pseudomonas TaxID=286 RepID=A0A1L7NBV4_PSEPU|nr:MULTISPECIES: Ku protein [Pseudomonas]PNB62269.1 Ku protein [Pseudomonas sp. FW305-130]AGN78822.1 DNA repair protein [Pseudomonas putida H8234]EKT4450112.1 Ku protein [Pseudomonas putida]EKT4560733.1 Ku protein [Pseudomonas putida]MBH3448569.1 Ku protein [Pseudomonas putida]